MAGFAFIGATFTDSMQKDNSRLFPIVVVLVVLALLLTFRTFGGVLLPLAVVIISIIWTMGIMVLFNGNKGLGIALCAIAGALAPLIAYGATNP